MCMHSIASHTTARATGGRRKPALTADHGFHSNTDSILHEPSASKLCGTALQSCPYFGLPHLAEVELFPGERYVKQTASWMRKDASWNLEVLLPIISTEYFDFTKGRLSTWCATREVVLYIVTYRTGSGPIAVYERIADGVPIT